jgi:hypothetical protein
MQEKPSLISLQIQMMEKKAEEAQKKFETLRFLSQAEVEKIVSDAKDLLAHYEYAISELMKPYASRDPSLMYFNELSCRILIEENPTSEEIARCEEILGQIKRCGLDIREAQDLISYRGAADEIEEVLAKIRQIVAQNLTSLQKFAYTAGPGTIIPYHNWLQWSSAIEELNEIIKIVYSMINDHKLGIINSFTQEGKFKFMASAIAANQEVKRIVLLGGAACRKISLRKGSDTQRIRTKIITMLGEMDVGSKDADGELHSGIAQGLIVPSFHEMPQLKAEDYILNPPGSLRVITDPIANFPKDKLALMIPPVGMDQKMLSTFRTLGICLLRRAAPSLAAAGDGVSTSSSEMESFMINASFPKGGHFAFRTKVDPDSSEKVAIIRKESEELIEIMKALGKPVTAIFTAAPPSTPSSLPQIISNPEYNIKPRRMSVILVDTLARLGVSLADLKTFISGKDSVGSDGYESGIDESDLFSVEVTSPTGWSYEVSYPGNWISFENQSSITIAAQSLVSRIQDLNQPSAVFLSWS